MESYQLYSVFIILGMFFTMTFVFGKSLPPSIQENKYFSNGKFSKTGKSDTRILFPFPQTPTPSRTSFLPDLGFLTDLGFLFLPEFPASGLVRVARDIFESENCVEKVACMVTDVSSRHSYLNWLHNLMVDFPFEGTLADRMKSGSKKLGSQCEYNCNPTTTMRRAFGVMKLLNDLVKINNIS